MAAGNIVPLPLRKLKPAEKRAMLGPEIGTEFDWGQRMFANFGGGDVFDYSEWRARDMSQMLVRDGQAAALEAVLTLPIRQARWAIEPAKGDKGEAEFAHSVLAMPGYSGGMETTMQTVIGQMTAAQIYRKAFFEKVFEIRPSDGKIVLKKIAWRPIGTCEVKRDEKTAKFDGFRQQVWMFGGAISQPRRGQKVPGYVEIPKQRAFVYIHGKHREPLVGTSELDLAYWCYRTKVKLLFLWYNFLEAQSLPKVITYGQSPEEANARADDVASMRQSGVVGWESPPEGKKAFDILETSGKGSDQFLDALKFLETWQTGSVLASFTTLSSQASSGRGSMALSQDQSEFFLMSRQAVTAEMQEDFTHQVVADLIRLNYGPGASYPKFVFGPLVEESSTALVSLFQTMVTAPALQVPHEILDLITVRMASVLQLDVDQVNQIIQKAAAQGAQQATAQAPAGMPQQSAAQLGRLAGGVSAAAGIARQAAASGNVGQVPQPSSGPMPQKPQGAR